MPRWTVESPTTLDFDHVAALRVRAISGSVAVLSTDNRPCLAIDDIAGQPLLVSHDDGVLTISYEDLTWDGLLGWLRPQRHSATITVTVPASCPVQLGVVNAGAVVSGIAAPTSVKSVSGKVTLEGVTGTVDAATVSADVEAQGVAGKIGFNSVSGDLTLADGSLGRLDAKTVSGRVTADIDLDSTGRLNIGTVSGPVTIRLPSQASTRVSLRSAAGRVQSEFPDLHTGHQPGAFIRSGQLGTGGFGQVCVTTMSGPITLLRRSDPAAAHPGAGPGAGPGPEGAQR